jgi:uncharacterized damage-inducible protein DinB
LYQANLDEIREPAIQWRLSIAKKIMTKRIVLLQALATTEPDLIRILRNRDETTGNWRTSPREWSCHDILVHLVEVERAYLARLKRVLSENEPIVPAIHPGDSHEIPDSLENLIDAFRDAREETLVFLQGVSPAGWQRAAIHETKGRVTMRFLVQDLVNHDIEHTNQIVETIQKWRHQTTQIEASAD